jgi:hypothetical protein
MYLGWLTMLHCWASHVLIPAMEAHLLKYHLGASTVSQIRNMFTHCDHCATLPVDQHMAGAHYVAVFPYWHTI